ncbi:MAG TPA: prepilin-type N-terminal cleavage/methylation domain-containing protein [Verrucomicrobiae bacterium]|nr:prepilin-type N-terminal cleavage/methylation domain-containing protein [Verrucomicrobiae bacterium]
MYQKFSKQKEGFTIIEVLIVLAIAGLIMLIVFLAVPALQRNSRNNARNNDASRLASSITECLSNHNGNKAVCNNSVTGNIQPGTLSQLTYSGTFSDGVALGAGTTSTVAIGFQRTCNTSGDDDIAGGVREFAVMFQIENAVNRCIAS